MPNTGGAPHDPARAAGEAGAASDGSLNQNQNPIDLLKAALEENPEAAIRLSGGAYRFVGPLPDPATLKGYDEISPGAADRIIANWEKQSDHRQRLENRSQHYAAMIVTVAIAAGVVCTVLGQPWVGGGIAIAAILGVSGAALLRLKPGQRG